MSFLDRINAEYFDGALSTAVLEHMAPVDDERPEVQAWIERMARQMVAQRFSAQDLNEVKAWALGSILTRILPGAWGGSVPPITLDGRHAAVDEYMARNRWRPLADGDRFLDLGCGFPPKTTLDTAKRFPRVRIVGADPSFGRYMVKEENGDYACFDDDRQLLYFQNGTNEAEHWEDLFSDPDATRERFRSKLLDAVSALPEGRDAFGSTEVDGAVITKNPVVEFATDHLTFEETGVGSDGLGTFDMVRCFNVLCYFERSFRRSTLDWLSGVVNEGGIFLTGMNWSRSRNARYAVYRSEGGSLRPKEFSFSVEGIRPLEIISWFALHDDDFEMEALAELIGTVRADEAFRADFDHAMDEALAPTGFTSRKEDGYLGFVDLSADLASLDAVSEVVGGALEAAGYADRTVEVLRAAGYDAWINCVGHISVDPAGMKAFAE